MTSFKIPEYIKRNFDKYKYVLLVCVVGLALALWPTAAKREEAAANAADSSPEELYDTGQMERALEEAFESIQGVGRVRVLLTVKSGFESVYAYDETRSGSQSDAAHNASSQSTLVTVSSGGESPVVRRVNYPVFLGAVVICDGGDNGRIKLELTNAIKSLTGITADNIVITKMKN